MSPARKRRNNLDLDLVHTQLSPDFTDPQAHQQMHACKYALTQQPTHLCAYTSPGCGKCARSCEAVRVCGCPMGTKAFRCTQTNLCDV